MFHFFSCKLVTLNMITHKKQEMENMLHSVNNLLESCQDDLIGPSQHLEFSMLNKFKTQLKI